MGAGGRCIRGTGGYGGRAKNVRDCNVNMFGISRASMHDGVARGPDAQAPPRKFTTGRYMDVTGLI